MKKIISILVILSLTVMTLCSCSGALSDVYRSTEDEHSDTEIADMVIEQFMPLTEIPRQSHNEKAVSDYLVKWAEERNFAVTQDDCNNVIFDVPASEGCENFPVTVLQCHMDMVLAVDEGYNFNPKTDAITVIRSEETLKAEHTSLGADNGIGIAMALYLVENCKYHGPLRIIITTDEEDTMTGAVGLDPSKLSDVKYFINMDSENSDEITIGSAGSVNMTFHRDVTAEKPVGDTTFELAITGSTGGHSGVDINDGRVNSLVSICDLLYEIKSKGVDYRVAYMKSGTAANAIPVSAVAVITANASDKKTIEDTVSSYAKELQSTYSINNPDINCTVKQSDKLPDKVISAKDSDALICLVQNATSGVYTMSQKRKGSVESSNNLGILKADTDGIDIKCLVRSSEEAPKKHIYNSLVNLSGVLGFSVDAKSNVRTWSIKTDNALAEKASEIYERQNDTEPTLVALHAGLECGVFYEMNRDMDIISVGPDVTGPHTTEESVDIASFVKVTRWIYTLLGELSE